MLTENLLESMKLYLASNNITKYGDDMYRYSANYDILVLLFLCEHLLAGDPKILKQVKVIKKCDFNKDYASWLEEKLTTMSKRLKDGLTHSLCLAATNDKPSDDELIKVSRDVSWYCSEELNSFFRDTMTCQQALEITLAGYGVSSTFEIFMNDICDRPIGTNPISEYDRYKYNGLPLMCINVRRTVMNNLPYKYDRYGTTYHMSTFTSTEANYLMYRGFIAMSYRNKSWYPMNRQTNTFLQNKLCYLIQEAFKDDMHNLKLHLYPVEMAIEIIQNTVGGMKKYMMDIMYDVALYLSRGCKRYWEDDVIEMKTQAYTEQALKQLQYDLKRWVDIQDLL